MHSGVLNGKEVQKEGIYVYVCVHVWASQVVLVVKNPPANAGDVRDPGRFTPWVRKIPWRCAR